MEKWFVINKGADFEKLGKEFGISPVTARLIRNREVIGEAAFERYLNGHPEIRRRERGWQENQDCEEIQNTEYSEEANQ